MNQTLSTQKIHLRFCWAKRGDATMRGIFCCTGHPISQNEPIILLHFICFILLNIYIYHYSYIYIYLWSITSILILSGHYNIIFPHMRGCGGVAWSRFLRGFFKMGLEGLRVKWGVRGGKKMKISSPHEGFKMVATMSCVRVTVCYLGQPN